MNDYLYDKSGDDPAVAELEGLLGVYAHRAPLRDPPPRRRRWRAVATVGGVLALAAIALVLWRRGDDGCNDGNGFAFSVAGGAARCGGGLVSAGTLPVGGWLETSGSAVAEVRVADIGKLTIHGDSRVRLVGTGTDRHHLELARGKVKASVIAPPRLFVVDTPVATAFDLGCEYELTVEADGRTRLIVTSGAVSLEGKGLVAYAPMGSEVTAAPGRGPGTPVAVQAGDQLRAQVRRFDEGDAAALGAILQLARIGDAITLWNLLSRTAGADREAVVRRLDELSPLPEGVRAEDVIRGDRDAFGRWLEVLEDRWLCPECFDD
jgi:ferric-dicitrate binding protein FerR (iron transport regulator)